MYSSPEVIERCRTSRGEIQLQRRGCHYELISNGTFLMATYNGESEQWLVQAALDATKVPERVLIGGLGVGFSLAQALQDPRVQQVTVVEIEEKIIQWNQSYLAPYSNHGLCDSRTEVVKADLVQWLRRRKTPFDAICLDIDNGPDWTVTELNRNLYEYEGLQILAQLLRSNGAVAFWSASPSPDFVKRLERVFSQVSEFPIPQKQGIPDYVYVANQPKGFSR